MDGLLQMPSRHGAERDCGGKRMKDCEAGRLPLAAAGNAAGLVPACHTPPARRGYQAGGLSQTTAETARRVPRTFVADGPGQFVHAFRKTFCGTGGSKPFRIRDVLAGPVRTRPNSP